ncbi:hypothetical protein PIB30_029343 [Stylosanthes scabra]|uniref:Leucine-rich repeat-containing N-terminal plant-type domain-containing protein n=1 Tax=Stylosanthes scabra TaxID=79078 RepID=A0ABU6RBL2_9FABA|nr:hypothetical protein [Stylosanthes scabra]
MRRNECPSNATAVVLVLVVLLITQIEGSYGCLQPERHALLNFKTSLIAVVDTETLLPSWEGDGDCCEWEGITCDNLTRHILTLDLNDPCSKSEAFTSESNKQLESQDCRPLAYAFEEVSQYLSELQHLTYLDLYRVSIQVVPAFLGSMQHLRFLSLVGDSETPLTALTIPSSSIGNLTNLRALYLDGFTLSNVTASTWLAPLSSLQYLGLSGVDLSMPQPHNNHLFKVLNTLPSLLHLQLVHCGLGFMSSPHHSDPIIHLTNLTRLQLLNLASNYLNQDSPVLQAFQNTTSIKVLDISFNGLTFVPPWLAKLHNLVKLDLSANSIITVPDPLRNLTSIQYLQLSYNENLISLPLWFPHLDKLQVLSLSVCGLSGQVPSSLENMTSIRSLDLSYNSLSSILPLWLGKFENLVELHLSSNLLYGPITYALRNLTSLTLLDLSHNNLNSLPSWLGELKSLVHLDLSENNFTYVEEGFELEILSNLCHLHYFDLSFCIGKGIALKNNGTLSGCNSYALESLYLDGNEFGGLLPSWLGQLKNLMYFSLESNSFSGPIPFSIGNLTKLTELRLRGNNLNGSIPHTLVQLVNLEVLDLSSNRFSGVIPQRLGQLKNLQLLHLSSNNFSGFIPQSLSQLKNLQDLELSSNNFSGFIPQSLSQLKNLQYLELSSNNFSGFIPQNLSQLKNLIVLDLSSNYLQATMNELINSWPQLLNLESLDLSHNQIIGSIPESLPHKMPKLVSLLLHDNHINGSLPSSLGKIENLYSLDLSNNKLSGKIPSTLWNHSSLAWLHLNNNKFQGKLPSSLGNMEALTLLDVGENHLSGFIPSWNGSEFPNLQIIRMRRNMLSGSIPSSLCQFVALQILDLAQNNLVGPIPHCIGNITGMTSAYTPSSLQYYSGDWDEQDVKQVIKGRELDYIINLKYVVNLDLSNNLLSGSIPAGISSLAGLIGLNLSYNVLSGEIPEMMGDMKSLESIDFSHNHLSGAIPRSMSDLTFLSHLNLSYNNLSGPIPDGSQFQVMNDPSCYDGNQYLCGAPLPKLCPGDGPHHVPNIEGNEAEDGENEKLEKVLFYFVIFLGFGTGFWGIIGVLYFKKNWRYVCFGYADKVADRVYVAVVLKVRRLKMLLKRDE